MRRSLFVRNIERTKLKDSCKTTRFTDGVHLVFVEIDVLWGLLVAMRTRGILLELPSIVPIADRRHWWRVSPVNNASNLVGA